MFRMLLLHQPAAGLHRCGAELPADLQGICGGLRNKIVQVKAAAVLGACSCSTAKPVLGAGPLPECFLAFHLVPHQSSLQMQPKSSLKNKSNVLEIFPRASVALKMKSELAVGTSALVLVFLFVCFIIFCFAILFMHRLSPSPLPVHVPQ